MVGQSPSSISGRLASSRLGHSQSVCYLPLSILSSHVLKSVPKGREWRGKEKTKPVMFSLRTNQKICTTRHQHRATYEQFYPVGRREAMLQVGPCRFGCVAVALDWGVWRSNSNRKTARDTVLSTVLSRGASQPPTSLHASKSTGRAVTPSDCFQHVPVTSSSSACLPRARSVLR
jgi:hypothetical protein